MSPDFEERLNRLEWCTPLPVLHEPRESPVFTLNGIECYFTFVVDICSGNWCYSVYMELTKRQTDFQSCYVKFQIGFKKEETLFAENGRSLISPEQRQVWNTDIANLSSNLPWDYPAGNWIKFIFDFESAHEPIRTLKINKETEDKCVQTASYLNVDTSVESLHEDFSKLLKTELDPDVEVICEEHSLMAHKLVLSARSDVLKAALGSDMLERQSGVVELKDLDGIYFEDFIGYLYTGIMPELTLEKAKALYEVGDKYAVMSLKRRCSEYLQDNLSSEHAFECFVLADAHSDPKLKDRIITFMLDTEMYLQREYWTPFCDSFPKVAIEVYRLSYEEDYGE